MPTWPKAEILRNNLALLMPYAVEIRYPDNWIMPSAKDSQEARAAVEEVINLLKVSKPDLFEKHE